MDSSQKKAVSDYRARQASRGFTRFEVQALEADKELIRNFARKLSEQTAAAQDLRDVVQQRIGGSRKGGVLAMLRQSPLVGEEIEFERLQIQPRDLDF